MSTSVSENPVLRRTVKDDLFCDLFAKPEYLLELYQDLHPEDTTTQESDLKLVTLERVVTTGPYNDLGFVANNRLVVLVEAQSTWSPNIATRMLFYLAETYREIVRDTSGRGALYGSKLIKLPEPELYVLYTGTQDVPSTVSFKSDVLDSTSNWFDFTVRVLTDSDGIVGQYVRFSQVFDAVRMSCQDPSEKAKALLDTCIERGILSEYLQSRRKEVESIMFTLFDQEEATRYYENELREKAIAEGVAQGVAQGMAQGVAQGVAQSIKSLMEKQGLSADEAMGLLSVPEDIREQVAALL